MTMHTRNGLLVPFVEQDLNAIILWHFTCAIEALENESGRYARNLLIVGYDALCEDVIDDIAYTEAWPPESYRVAARVHREMRKKHLDSLIAFASDLACGRHQYRADKAAERLLDFCHEAAVELYTVCVAAGKGAKLKTRHGRGTL